METWERIKEAVEIVNKGIAKRLDLEGAIVYEVPPKIIRIDIKKEDLK